jgi:putative transposase
LAKPNSSNLRLLIDPTAADIPIARQCSLLGLSRSSYYYTPVSESAENLQYMRLMDEQYTKTPFYGVWQMVYHLRNLGYTVNPKRIRRLMRLMRLVAICPGPHTSKPGKGEDHQVFPYLLNNITISYPGQVVGTDITYIPLKGGFLYLVAYIDWYSRYVISWELSNSLEASFCIEALQDAQKVVVPAIVNTDQGSQFTCNRFVEAVLNKGSKLSMDSKGRAIDNVFTERFWRSLKYEEVYLREYRSGQEAWQSIDRYMRYYNEQRPNSKLDGASPVRVFNGELKVPAIHRTAKV